MKSAPGLVISLPRLSKCNSYSTDLIPAELQFPLFPFPKTRNLKQQIIQVSFFREINPPNGVVFMGTNCIHEKHSMMKYFLKAPLRINWNSLISIVSSRQQRSAGLKTSGKFPPFVATHDVFPSEQSVPGLLQ